MAKITYQGDHKEFINRLFSKEFIEQSKTYYQSFYVSLMDSITIQKPHKEYIYPTNLFERLNYACGDHNTDLDYEVFQLIMNKQLSSAEILSLLIADMLAIDERFLDHYLEYFNQQNDEVKGAEIEKLLAYQHDKIPYYLYQRFNNMIYNFASEFDISDGKMLVEDYEEKLEFYKNFDASSSFIF